KEGEDSQRKAVEALKLIGSREAQKILAEIAGGSFSADIRLKALEGLSARRHPGAIPQLIAFCQKGTERQATEAASLLLRYGREGQERLKSLMRSRRRPTALAAARALASVGFKDALEVLKHQSSPRSASGIQALITLAKTGDKDALEKLMELLKDGDPRQRLRGRAALFSVGLAGAPRLMEGLKDPNPLVRAECARILGSLGVQQAREEIARLTTDPDETVRAAAVSALALIRQAGP
ncbi:MAG: HEAT repeat domain-containing protein, partial [Armatimonadetes bacterium]|nr:HEAT repeat domain-containing protein [Armatimonadota bacterium]MDW8122202.1 HEAT repeat domain-containing protein [Armatimonadota bacterium]